MWEITGAEFSKAQVHTADGISIRFPRVTRIRTDKDWASATNLTHLKVCSSLVVYSILFFDYGLAHWQILSRIVS